MDRGQPAPWAFLLPKRLPRKP